MTDQNKTLTLTRDDVAELTPKQLEIVLTEILAGAIGPWSAGTFDAEEGDVIDSIEATGPPPLKATGDLGQVSVGLTGAEVTTVGLMGWTLDWKRTVVKSTTTDGNGWAGNLASTAEWSATVEAAYIDDDVSQDTLRLAVTTLQTASAKYNFFNTPGTGRDSYSGTGYLTGIKFTSKIGAIFGMSLTITGDGPIALVPQLAPQTGTAPAIVAED